MRNEQRDFYFLLHGSPLLRRSPANLGFLILFSLSKSKKYIYVPTSELLIRGKEEEEEGGSY